MFNLILFAFTVSAVESQNNNCGSIYTQERLIIESPNYPSSYPKDFNCSYVIKGPVCPVDFHFQFLDFNLEASVGCTKDRLAILDKDALCGTKTGEKNYHSTNGVLFLKFLTDSDGFGRGFRILITRSNCKNTTKDTTTKKILPQTPQLSSPNCCQDSYQAKHFYLTSPGFPQTNNQLNDCLYKIYKANQNVCRLRIHFKYFWSGRFDEYFGCSKSFLEIDGKRICGCKIGLKLISAFDPWSNSPKIIRFKNEEYTMDAFNGFILEVIQDECPKRYSPALGNQNSSTKGHVRYNNDQINRVSWLNSNNENLIGKARLISEDTEILSNIKSGDGINQPVYQHVYVFAEPEFYEYTRIQPTPKRDIEETDYVDTKSIQRFLPNNYDYECKLWDLSQFDSIKNSILWKNTVPCNAKTSTSRRCLELNSVRGYFQSPGYPYFYPPNLNICYRIRKLPGYCFTKMTILDFDIENSYDCTKDYFLLGNNYKYCGQRLFNAVSTFDLRGKLFEEAVFISDGFKCGRGFRVVYDQIPCQDIGYLPPTFDQPSTTPPTLRPLPPCNRVIREDQFTIDILGNNQATCRYDIIKSSPRICRLIVNFLANNLNCQSESFAINNRQYCHQGENTNYNIDFYGSSITMLYQRTSLNRGFIGLRLRLNAFQSEECSQLPDVPPERQIRLNLNDTSDKAAANIKGHEKEICGVIVNSTEITAPETLCQLLKEDKNVSQCLPIAANSIYVPLDNGTKELKLLKTKKSRDVTLQKVYCNEIL